MTTNDDLIASLPKERREKIEQEIIEELKEYRINLNDFADINKHSKENFKSKEQEDEIFNKGK